MTSDAADREKELAARIGPDATAEEVATAIAAFVRSERAAHERAHHGKPRLVPADPIAYLNPQHYETFAPSPAPDREAPKPATTERAAHIDRIYGRLQYNCPDPCCCDGDEPTETVSALSVAAAETIALAAKNRLLNSALTEALGMLRDTAAYADIVGSKTDPVHRAVMRRVKAILARHGVKS